MCQYEERDKEEDRKPGGKEKEDVLDRTKWKRDIHKHSGDPRRWEKLRRTDLPSHEDEVSVLQFAVVEVIRVELLRKLIVERQELPLQNRHFKA